MAQDIRDRSGNLLGKISELSDGKLEIRDKSGNLKGKYDPKTNETRDKSGNLFGKGNQLTTLLDR